MRGILVLLLAVICADAYRILVVSPLPGKSHGILGDGLVRHLADAGHEIFYITPYIPKKAHENVTILDVSDNHKHFGEVALKYLDFEALLDKSNSMSDVMALVQSMLDMVVHTFNNPNVMAFLKDENQKMDLLLIEWMYTELYAGLQPIFDCPFVWFSTIEPHWRILQLVDELPNPAYTTDTSVSSYPPFSFSQRALELGVQALGLLVEKFYINPWEHQQYRDIITPIIEARGRVAPSYEQLRFNASLVFGNSHVSLGLPVRLPDSYKAIGGYHIEEAEPLPKDLQKLMDEATNGVIYFSMGSNLRSQTLPARVKADLVRMFGQLPHTVLWKFEEDLPDRPENLHIVSWAPQSSILAHKNCVLFITHGGLLSTTETVHYGVPVVGVPVFADQFLNVQRAEKKGFAKQVDLSYDLARDLKAAIEEVMSNPSYREKVKELSYIYHDRPAAPGRELVHWVEHVIRTRGAPHLRSPALLVPWYQKMYLDLAVVVLSVVLVTVSVVRLGLRHVKRGKVKLS